MKKFKLCISSVKCGKTDTFDFGAISNNEYEIVAIDDERELEKTFNTQIHSVHVFPPLEEDEKTEHVKIRNGDRVSHSYGLIIDVDNELHDRDGKRIHDDQLTLEVATNILDRTGFAFAIYSSKSDRLVKDKHEKDGNVDRYHMLIPFTEPLVYNNDNDRTKYKLIYNHFVDLFNGYADTACSDLARIIYPTRSDSIRTHFELDKPFYDWKQFKMPESGSAAHNGQSAKSFRLTDSVKLAKSKKQVKVSDIKRKAVIYCPFHDDKNASAFINVNDKGIPYICCSSCKKTFNLDVSDQQNLNDYQTLRRKYIFYDDELSIKTKGDWMTTNLEKAKNGILNQKDYLPAKCLLCDSMEALIKLNIFDKAVLTCKKCEKRLDEDPIAPGMFSYKTKVYKVEMRNGKFGSMEQLKKENFYSTEEYEFVQGVMLSPKHKFLDDNFQIQRIGSADFEKLDYELNFIENALVFKYPALPVKKKDNGFINNWLDQMFGEYTEFIKDWMALYSYTNYQMLPVIVLSGPRACGKTTFAEVVGEIFPNLQGFWSGVSGSFNEEFRKKLLIVDENKHADKSEQYTAIKEITGKKTQKINEKFTPEYYVPNNIKIIITTNDARPVFLKWKEEPESDNTNNFFIYRVPPVLAGKIDSQLQQKVLDRLGHYVRSELKSRYEALSKQDRSNSRYILNAPITHFAKELFASSKTGIELEAETLAEALVCGYQKEGFYKTGTGFISKGSEYKFRPIEIKNDKYVKPGDLNELIKQLGLSETRNKKAYINALVEAEVITPRNDYRMNNRRLGHKILRKSSYYPEEAAGIGEEPF